MTGVALARCGLAALRLSRVRGHSSPPTPAPAPSPHHNPPHPRAAWETNLNVNQTAPLPPGVSNSRGTVAFATSEIPNDGSNPACNATLCSIGFSVEVRVRARGPAAALAAGRTSTPRATRIDGVPPSHARRRVLPPPRPRDPSPARLPATHPPTHPPSPPQWFVNLADNGAHLDPSDFSPFGELDNASLAVVDSWYAGEWGGMG